MPLYDENRRSTAVPRLSAITKNEATEGTDLRRQEVYERERDRLADELRKQNGEKRRSFADLVKKK